MDLTYVVKPETDTKVDCAIDKTNTTIFIN
jgi:hypothetical protein